MDSQEKGHRSEEGLRQRGGQFVVAFFLSSLIALTGHATVTPDSVKHTPSSVTAEPSASLPPEVQALETQSAAQAFDRDTLSVHTAFEAGAVVAQFDTVTEVQAIKVFGAAPYAVTVEAEITGAWQAIAGLENLNLTQLSESWHHYAATTPVASSRLRFALTPVAGSSAAGIKAIEIWGKGSRVNFKNGLALLTALRGVTPPNHARLYTADLAQGVIGATAGGVDDPADNTFTVTLDRAPADFKRAYLAYDVLGLAHWAHAVRQLNAGPKLGGFVLPVADIWSTQVEEINPESLVRGANRITFSAPLGSTGTYTVRDVYLVAELESGANFVAEVSANLPADINSPAAVLDGDLATGWTPYPTGSVKSNIPTLTAIFDKPTELAGAAFYLANSLKGTVELEYLTPPTAVGIPGTWVPSGAGAVAGRSFTAGWNTITAGSPGPMAGMRLVFRSGPGSSAEIKEISPSGSGVGQLYTPPQIAVSYPDSGQYFGRSAHLRGFIQPRDNGSGAAALFVAGQPAESTNGEFALTVTKDDVGLGAQGDAESWSVELKAVYPDGGVTINTVVLNNHQAAILSTEGSLLPQYNVAVPPGQLKKINYDAADLEIDATALAVETTIGVTPLNDADLPALDAGMTNVTKGPRKGYRFTPHGMKFKNKIKLTLPYNKAKLPPGHTEQDIKTFYFDEEAGSWKELERIEVNAQTQMVVSYTDHFTDFINATVTVPDSPQLAQFNPTQIKDIKAVNPGAKVNLIGMPSANAMGDARLSYPIEVPPGRNGLQPKLSLQYNSAGNNGWTGLGWNLAMLAIEIDTRWGVPRYDTGQIDGTPRETETYLLNGEQLTPVAHRGALRARTAEKAFHSRVEGEFRRIVRHGDGPANYWWEVTDKNGMRFLYGGGPDLGAGLGGVDPNAVLSDPGTLAGGNIFKWLLRAVVDTNGNSINYRYDVVNLTDNGPEPARQVYLSSIRYTGRFGLEDGAYEVVFNRTSSRPDVIVDGRPGFKTVMTDRLTSIEVKQVVGAASPLIRRYELEYVTGQFEKSLLSKITQFGEDGITPFNSHELDYFDEVATGTPGLLNSFGLSQSFLGSTVNGSGLVGDVDSTAFSALDSDSNQVHFYGGIAIGSQKEVSAGAKVGAEFSDTDTLLILIDIDGDSLPDQLLDTGGGIAYRKNLGGPGAAPNFAPAVGLPSLSAIGVDSSSTLTFGAQGFALGINGLADISLSRNRSDTYLSDVNGDGLPDLVFNRTVFFNRLDANGVPSFQTSSPTPIGVGAPSDASGLVENPEQDRAAIEAAFHLADPLLRWTAPYSGTIDITGQVALLSVPDPDYLTADGVRVAIQLEAAEIFSLPISDPTDLTPKPITGLTGISVMAGQRLYFRVNSINDGAFDAVAFDPTITYRTVGGIPVDLTDVDERGLPIYVYTGSQGFAFGGQPLPFFGFGNAAGTLSGDLVKPAATSDDVTVRVSRNGIEVFSQTVAATATGTFPISLPLITAPGDEILVRLEVDSRIDLSGITFAPTFTVQTLDGVPAPVDQNGNPLLVFQPAVTSQIYPTNASTTPFEPWVSPGGAFNITQNVTGAGPANFDGNVTLTVKRAGLLLAKQRVEIRNGVIVGPSSLNATLIFNAGDEVFFTADATNADTLSFFTIGAPQIPGTPDPIDLPFDIHLGIPDTEALGGGYRRWAYGEYNGNDSALPIDQSRLRLPVSETDNAIQFFVTMIPFPEEDHWRAQDRDAFIGAGQMSSTRLGAKFLDFPDGSNFGGARAVARAGGGRNVAGNISVLAFGAGVSNGRNFSDIDFLDFNGDNYPDVVGGGQVQASLPNGGLEGARVSVGGFGRVRESDSLSLNINLGASTSMIKTDSENRIIAMFSEQGPYNLGAGVSGSRGEMNTEWDLIDVNGDGLPDFVSSGVSSLKVRLNLGYRFGAEEDWGGSGTLRFEESANFGFSGSASFTRPAYSFGGGLSSTENRAGTEQDLIDVNGDGLLDIVSKNLDVTINATGNDLTVRLNTGNGFTAPLNYRGGLSEPVQKRTTVSRNLGLHFTIAIPIPFTPFSVILNPGFNRGENLGGSEVQLRDFDGDGYPDHVFSDTNGNVAVSLNNRGRTNLLRKVFRPLGGEIALDYERAGNTTDNPQNRWVLTGTVVFDGFVGDGVDFQVSSFVYEDGKWDRAEREFYGFRTVTENQLDSTTVVGFPDAATIAALPVHRSIVQTYLNNSFYTKGLLKTQVTQDGLGAKFLETINTYNVVTVADGAGILGLEDFTETRFPQLVRTDRNFYEGQAVARKTTHRTFAYDVLGNVTRFFDAADIGAADDVEALLGYFSDVANYIVGKANSIVVNGNGVQMRRREATFQPGTGNMLQVRRFLASGEPAVSDLTYDAFGNIASVTGPANQKGERYALTYTYDSVVNTYAVSFRDSFGYSSSASYNLTYGEVENTTDINGQPLDRTYDSVGRTATITGPHEAGTGLSTITFEYHPEAAVPWALTKHIDTFRALNDPIETVLFIDGVKRLVQTKKDGAVHTGLGNAPSDVMKVSGRLTYDFVGRAIEQFYPVTEPLGQAGVFNPAVDTVQPTRLVYDVLDRNISITAPDNTTTTTVYDFGPDHLNQVQFRNSVTDANGNTKEIFRDVRKLTVAIKEVNAAAGQPVIWTSYAYDAQQQIVEVRDASGNVTTASYDNFGRRTVIDSPDAGRAETVFDLADNLTAKITASLRAAAQTISYDYTFNRLNTITYPQFPENNVAYTYGLPGASDNRANRVVTVSDESGVEERFYGPLGEVVKSIKTVNSDTQGSSINSPEVYTTEFVFDTWNRMQSLIYPDAEILVNTYDSGGLLASASGSKAGFKYNYIDRLEYDKFEQRVFVAYGNGVETTFAYDPLDRRLATLTTGKGAGNPFQNLRYIYDNVGNILSLANDVAVPPPSQFGGPTSQHFVYDDLYRLTGASGSYQFSPNKSHQYTLAMSYDSIHNIVSKQQAHIIAQPSGVPITQKKTSYVFNYAYGAKPHAPIHIGDRTYTYDASGNQLGWDHDQNGTRRTITWDEENRIQAIADNGHTITYKYNDEGQRVIKRGPQGETVYVNQFFTIRNREGGTKHVFAGPTRAVSKLMKQDKPGANPKGKPPVEKDLYFYHPNHLGSTGYVTDTNGKLFQHIEYFPFGETWVEEASNTQRTPYLFTAKELDEETQLYYFGARYFDPRTSVWQSPDPILGAYLDGTPFGGVYVPPVLNLYGYALQNPVKYQDPDGEFVNFLVGAAIGAAVDAGIQGVLIATGAQDSFDWTSLAVSAGAGATGVGVANLARRAVQAGRLAAGAASVTGETAINLGEQAVRGEETSLTRAVGDALLGEGVGELVSRVGRRLDGSPCSFAEGTLVLTEDGLVPIETLEVGDLVLARDEVTGAEDWHRVLQVFADPHDSVLELRLATEDGVLAETVVTTAEHPFYVHGKGWIPAGDIAAGDALRRSGGKWLTVTASRVIDKPQLAYNLDVAGFDTFFVGQSRAWVHNGPCGRRGETITANAEAGRARQATAKAELETNNPAASVQSEQLLRNAGGKKVIDPETGTGRRLDNVVIENGQAIDTVETTSANANKAAQIAKENRVREAGGTFVRDRDTRQLTEVLPSRIDRRP